jgi:hypothetical protein
VPVPRWPRAQAWPRSPRWSTLGQAFPARQPALGGAAASERPQARFPPAKLLEHPRDERSRHGRFAPADTVEGFGEPPHVHRLQQVPIGTGSQCGEEVGVFVRNGEHHDLRLRQPRADLPCGGEATAGHLDVEQADVGVVVHRGPHGFGGVRHLRADIEPVVSVERPAHVLAGRSVIIGDQHPK